MVEHEVFRSSGEQLFLVSYLVTLPMTVAARSKAWTVIARPNAGIVSSNSTQGIDVCVVCFYSMFVLLCV
jgi:hypothetical protein